ncbi:MAG: dihydrodipicolinate synthase family protein, partial [Turicibacter sp.]
MKSFGPVITAMVTPFDEYNQLNISSLRKLIIHLLKHGSTSLVITGTTGEAPTLTAIERLRIWETAVDFAGGTVPIIAGVGTNNTKTTIHNVKLAEEIGADAVLVVTPYY